MLKKIDTSSAPSAIGPYSQAIECNGFIFTSGQLPLDPHTMAFPEGGIEEQTRQSLHNLKCILDASGSSLDCVVKTICFLSDMNNFADFNRVYQEYFSGNITPSRSCIQAGRLPKDALVEIEAVAYRK